VNEINNTLKESKLQIEQYIENALGSQAQHLQKSAQEHGVLTRVREIRDAKLFLHLLLIYAVSNFSFRVLAVVATVLGAGNVTDEALRLKFKQCTNWLSFLINISLEEFKPAKSPFCDANMPIYLLDGTIFKQEGKKGKELRVHMCYNLSLGAMEEVAITDTSKAEKADVFEVRPRSLYMADAGFGKGTNYSTIVSQGANALFRFSPNQAKLASDADGKNILDMSKVLKTKKKLVQLRCYIHVGGNQYLPVRIIASRLPKDKALLAQERARRKASKQQRQIKDSTLIFCQWVILMTNLPDEYEAGFLLELYRSRWQIELLFKRIKQFFKVQRLKKASLEHSKVLVSLWLLIWSAVERKTLLIELYLLEQKVDMSRYSIWVASNIVFEQFVAKINLVWALYFDIDIHYQKLYSLAQNHKASRNNQYSDIRFRQAFLLTMQASSFGC